nr:restriction endonuclease [Bacilli bacterium]
TSFPSTKELSFMGRELAFQLYPDGVDPIYNPDHTLLLWTDCEHKLFRGFESREVKNSSILKISSDFDADCTAFLSLMNRRKTRAGKSLENQLSQLFIENHLPFTAQGTTEKRKKPDFIFPSIDDYHDMSYPGNKLISLAAKTTCKDRWRQIINEADRTLIKYLCTLQKGISAAQMDEMKDENVQLVVPKANFSNFPSERKNQLLSVKNFIDKVKSVYGL